MPYITQAKREALNPAIEKLTRTLAVNYFVDGDLNYTITKIILSAMEFHGEKYSVYNTLIGVLECAKQELYRKKIAAYEETKIEQNGDL